METNIDTLLEELKVSNGKIGKDDVIYYNDEIVEIMVNLHYKNLCDLYVKFPDKFDYNMFHGKLIIKKEDYTEEFNNEIINLMFRAWKNEFNNQL